MTYERFERLVLIVGGLAIVGAMSISLGRHAVIEELVGQVLLLLVLLGAVHWGRKGGFAAAVAASLAYFVIRVPSVVAEGGLNLDLSVLLAIRMATYGSVGILGGELCGRIKYFFARIDDSSSIDEWTRVYNHNAISRSLAAAHGQHTRYGNAYSVILLTLAPQLTEELRPSRQRMLLRRVAAHVRADVRLVDDLGRLNDGRFLLVLPQTPLEGAKIASGRVRAGVRELLGAKDESVTSTVLGTPDDTERLAGLLAELLPDHVDDAPQAQASASVA